MERRMEQVKCKKCQQLKYREFKCMIGKNYVYIDEAKRRWKNSEVCPECFKEYNRLKAAARRSTAKGCIG
jgi:hypothetical protein